MIPSTQSEEDCWAADINFVFSECVRIQSAIESTQPPFDLQQIPKADLDGSLPHPSGSGDMIIGLAAARRVWQLAEQALKRSDASGTLETERVRRALSRILVTRFINERRPLDGQSAEAALCDAVDEAKRDRRNTVHFMPCRLMYAGNPDTLTIGPVTFLTSAKFNALMAPHFETFIRRNGTPQQVELDEGLLADARHYYDDFTWVAQIEVLNCDESTSRTRAEVAATAALNILHLVLGAFHTRRMTVAGPRLDRDQRARFSLSETQELGLWSSSGATSAVGFEDGWGRFLEGDDTKVLLRGAAKALEPLVNPSVQRPLGQRIVDAAAWFGDAVREKSPAAQIVKAVTGLEVLVMTDERKNITRLLCARGAALRYHPNGDKSFGALEGELRDAYRMRSRLVHGSLSPFDPEVADYAPRCLELTEEVICAGLGLFEVHGLLDEPRTNQQLAEGFGSLVSWAKARSAEMQGE
jgi:hypothetical protein